MFNYFKESKRKKYLWDMVEEHTRKLSLYDDYHLLTNKASNNLIRKLCLTY